jgi:RNA polymerase sigma-70 factor (ECF subfamily)
MNGRFRTTQWSLVRVGGDSADPALRREALEALCGTYWPPVYDYVRCRGYDAESARDLTQGFFTRLLDKEYLKKADRERGKFRSFLLTCVKRYLSDERDRARAVKRGGGLRILPLEFEAAESSIRCVPADRRSPETIFEKRWAVAVVRQAVSRLEREMERSNKGEQFRRLRPWLTGRGPASGHRMLAVDLGISEQALRVTIHRLRRRLGHLLREEVASTLSDPAQLDAEMHFLFEALGS